MRLTIFTAGSRGDVQPCLALGKALQRAGFAVRLAAPENFSAFVGEHGLSFHPLRGDVRQMMASQTGRTYMESGSANPITQIRAMRAMLGPVALNMAMDALEACRDSEALIALAVFAPFAKTIAESLGVPLIHVEPTPLLPTRLFPAPGWPVQRDLGGLHNRLSGLVMLQVIGQWYAPFVRGFRRRLGLSPSAGGSFHQILRSAPLLGAYSSLVVPPPPDWPAHAHLTGYWFPDQPPGWQPPPELEAFLEAGDPPVYVGFGSMSGRRPEELAAIVLEALAQAGRRGLLLTGWGGLSALRAPQSVRVIDSAPHGWLFPRMAAVVHHGGAGTTAEGLRAGVPSVILPFMMDQPFWGRRVQALGVGPPPLPLKKLDAGRLAQAIHAAMTDMEMRRRAASLGAAIRGEDGVGKAVEIIRRYLG